MKTIDEHFRDWFDEPFGFGYGSGERPILTELRRLTTLLHQEDPETNGHQYTYQYEELEAELGMSVTWLLINVLAKNNDIEYGTSPRYGWFYGPRARVVDYIKEHTIDEMYEVVAGYDQEYIHCFEDYCSCRSTQVHHRCKFNPFWNDKPLKENP